MKKILAFALALVFFAQAALAADVAVTRTMADRVDPSGALSVSFAIAPTAATSFDLADLIPKGWTITDWSVTGFAKADITMDTQASQDYMGETFTGYHWKFNKNISSAVTLSYNLNVPVSSGSYKFVAVWTYPGGFNKAEKTLIVGAATTAATSVATTAATTAATTTATTTVPVAFDIRSLALPIGVLIIAVIVILLAREWMKFSKQKKAAPHESAV